MLSNIETRIEELVRGQFECGDPPYLRFFSRVEELPNGCWHWFGPLNEHGYGRFSVKHRYVQSHRWCYEELFEAVPYGLDLTICAENIHA